jgi:hypothetical protein
MENLPIKSDKKFKYSISYQTWDEESLEVGQTDNHGFVERDEVDTIGEVLYKANSDYGIYMPVSFGTWESTEPQEDRDYFEKGIRKYYGLHIKNEDGTEISEEENDFITFLLSDGRYEINKFREFAVGGLVAGAIAIGGLIAYFYFKDKKKKTPSKKVTSSKSVENKIVEEVKNTKKPKSNRSKSVIRTINGKDRRFPIKDAWRKEHSIENKSEKYEVPQRTRKPVSYAGGGVLDGISKEDYFLVVQNWVYFTFNYPMGFVKDAFNSKHLEGKFSSSYERFGSMGVLMNFWANLDGNNREILSLWIKNNYVNSSSKKTELQSISDDNYAKIITHWNMFCFNFPYKFVETVFASNVSHFEHKWHRAYESAGTTGSVNKFFTELSESNQIILTDWVYDNYKGMNFAGGGSVEDDLYVAEYRKGEWSVKDKKNPNAYYTLSSKKENAENVRQKLIDNPSTLKYYRSNEYAGGGDTTLNKNIMKNGGLTDGLKYIYVKGRNEDAPNSLKETYSEFRSQEELLDYLNKWKDNKSVSIESIKSVYHNGESIDTTDYYLNNKFPNTKEIRGVGKLGLDKIIKESKANPNELYVVTDDNYSNIGLFWLKNGKFAKRTVANENYDFQFSKVTLKPKEDVIYKSSKITRKLAGGGSTDLDYSDILNVLKSKIEDSIDSIPTEYENSSSFTGEEIEHESRDGFIPYTDGGYQAVWFEYISQMFGTGNTLPTKPLDDEMNRQIDYSYKLAKENFIEKYPELVEELGEENIDYHSLYEAGYGEEAEELSSDEMDMMSEDTILMRIFANYYNPDNSRAKDGKHTIRLFGDVNLESPYHRTGNLDDSYEYEFTFDSIAELESEMNKGLEQVISWFEGDMYNDSTAEMKVRRMADGGKAGGKWIIQDWAGNHLFTDKVFDSFEDGWDFIYENVKEETEDDGTYDDYFVVELESNDDDDDDDDEEEDDDEDEYAGGGYINKHQKEAIDIFIKKDLGINNPKDYTQKQLSDMVIKGYNSNEIEIGGSKIGKDFEKEIKQYISEKYAGGGEVEDWMEEALESLIEETGFDELEITMVSDNGNEFIASDDNVEYRVFKTEDDAEEKAIEGVREDMEESPENFNKDFIINYIDGRDYFENALNEMNSSYVEDIQSETNDTKFENRLIDELVEYGLMDKDDAQYDNAEEVADDLKSDYVDLLTEEQLDEGNNGLDYFIRNFGEEETMKMVIDNNLIDIDEASKEAVNVDGIAHFLSSYDGETLYLNNDFVAYRVN